LFCGNTGWGGEKYWNASVVSWLKNDFKSNLVRAAVGIDETGGLIVKPGETPDPSNKTRLFAVVDAAIANDMYVIIDFHSHNASNYQSQAISFFQEMATKYGNNNNVIYEIFNEPLSVSWSGVIKPYANAVIGAIRAIDPDNLIIVGTPNWSQDVDIAALDPITGYANIAYTLHFYAGTASHNQPLRDKASLALQRGIPLFVTEWGSVEASGAGAVNATETANWMTFMRNNNISNANWSINDKAEGASALTVGAPSTGGWTAAQLTASGSNAKGHISTWPALPAALTVPATIQAENYASMLGVQTETTTDTGGGSNVGYIDANDWMSYTNFPVTVPTTGTYAISYRLASGASGGTLQLEEAGGGAVLDTVTVNGTGGWQTWTTVTHNVTLTAGVHSLGLKAITGGYNINWFKIESSGAPASSTPASSAAASSAAANPSTTFQAESYIAMSGVTLETTTDTGGGQDVGYIDAGDWMSYANAPYTVATQATYKIEFRVAAGGTGGTIRLEEAGGSATYGSATVTGTGGWQNWTTVSMNVTLPAGSRSFAISTPTGGFNVNWFRVTKL